MDERQFDAFDWEEAAEQLTPLSGTAVPTGEAIAHTDDHADCHFDSHNDLPILC
jgi:hypothetical protein